MGVAGGKCPPGGSWRTLSGRNEGGEAETAEEAAEREAEFERQRSEYEEERQRREEERKQQFEQEQAEIEAERSRRAEITKAREATFNRILENAPAMFTAAQLRVFLRALVNLDPYALTD